MADYIERRGGKRAGAGRKKHPEVLLIYSAKLTPKQARLAKMWGDGNMSAGLRWLIDAAEILVRKREDREEHS